MVPSAPIPIGKSIGFRSGLGFLRFSTHYVFSCCDPGSEAEATARSKTKPPLEKCAFGPSAPVPIGKSTSFRLGFRFLSFSANHVFSWCDPGSEAEANARSKTEPPVKKFAFGSLCPGSYWKTYMFSIGYRVSAFFCKFCFFVL